MLEVRKKIFDNDIAVSDTTTELPAEMAEIHSAVQQAKCLYEQTAMEFINSVEQSDETQRYLDRFKANVKATETLEELITNATRLPENIRDLYMQHMSLLKPIENDITTELEEYLSGLEEKKKQASSSLKALSGVFNTVQSLSGYRSCPVCLSREISHYLIPCGHTFCTLCLDKHKGSCFLCRKSIASYNRLYFS
jgi:archaellum component FlaC